MADKENKQANSGNHQNQEDPPNRTISSYFDDPDKQYKMGRASIVTQLFGDVPEKEIFEEGSAEQIIEKRGAFPNKLIGYVMWIILVAGLVGIYFLAKGLIYNYILAMIFFAYWTAKGYVGKGYVWALVALAMAIMCFYMGYSEYGLSTNNGIWSAIIGLIFLVIVGFFYYSRRRLQKVKAEIEAMKLEIRAVRKQEKKEQKSSSSPQRPVYRKKETSPMGGDGGEILNLKIAEDEELQDWAYEDDLDTPGAIDGDDASFYEPELNNEEDEEAAKYASFDHPYAGRDQVENEVSHPYQIESEGEEFLPVRESSQRKTIARKTAAEPVIDSEELSDEDLADDDTNPLLLNLDKPYELEDSQFTDDDKHPF